MNLEISDFNKKYEIKLGNITQILGTNYKVKKYIYDSLIKHFSLYKYHEYDEHLESNVKIDGEVPGRKEYDIISIKDREELIEHIKLNKSTLIYEYLKNIIETLSCQKQMNILDDNLTNIFLLINEKLAQDVGDIYIDYEMQNLLHIVSKSEILTKSGSEIESLSNFKLINILFSLIKENNKFNPEKRIILFQDIDHLLNDVEYGKMISNLLDYDKKIYIVFSLGSDNYVYLNKKLLNNVVVFNNAYFQVPNYDSIEDFIVNHYPLNLDFSEKDVLLLLKKILNKVGIDDDRMSYKELLVKKMINKALCVNDLYDFNASETELTCLNSV